MGMKVIIKLLRKKCWSHLNWYQMLKRLSCWMFREACTTCRV